MAEISIGAAAEASGVKVTTIRFYEARGMMPVPARTAAGRRVYGPDQVARLRFIRHARALGFDLEDIAALLALSDDPGQDCSAADSIARAQLAQVEARIAQLQALAAELARMVQHCPGGAVAECRVIETLGNHALCVDERHELP